VETYGASDALDVDVYHVGHHGSYNGTTASLLQAMSPEAAVISMGRWDVRERWTAWQYGHPRRPVVERLQAEVTGRRPRPVTVKVADAVKRFSDLRLEQAIYATGWDGDIVIESGADGVLNVRTSR
jgi:competence protein ComEC